MTDDDLFAWLEKKLTLHDGVELLYVVDGYQVALTARDGAYSYAVEQGETLREAIAKLHAAEEERR